MITIYQKSIRDEKVKKIADAKPGSWIYVESPTDNEIEEITKKYDLDLGHIKDALDPFEVPRLEFEGKDAYIFTRIATGDEERTITFPLLVIITETALITVSSKQPPFVNKFTEGKVDFTTTQKTKFFLQIFSQINKTFSDEVTKISRNVRSTSVNLEDIDNKTIIQFVSFENVLNDFLSALVPTGTILKNLLTGKSLSLYEEDKDLIEDLMLANEQLTESCRSNLKNIVNIRESYSTIMTNNLNRVIKMLTSITIVLTIPMIITGLYGMNVALPLAENPFAFWIVLFIMVGIAGGILFALNKKRWF
jgi:magnesium transporter